MDNLKHLYFLTDNPTYGIGLRYTIGQVLFDIITVPDQVREACQVLRKCGAPRNYRPSFYMLKHVEKVYKELPYVEFDDVVFLSNQLGYHLALSRNNRAVINVRISEGTKIEGLGDIRKVKNIDMATMESHKTGRTFTAAIFYAPDFQ